MTVTRAYRDWRDRGAGGLPHNPVGWLVATGLRPLGRDTIEPGRYAWALPTTPPVDALSLPERQGPRPRLGPEPIPHRQVTQLPSTLPLPADAVTDLAAESAATVELRTSHFERRGEALFARHPDPRATWLVQSRGEVAHRHSTDGSWHVVLHPADAEVVIAAGWGERHPLAGVPMLGLPASYLIIYAARDSTEQDVVLQIVRAALRWAG